MAEREYFTLDDVEVKGKTVLVRVDINSPVDSNGRVTSDTRIRLHARTLEELAAKGARVVVLAHQGRKGEPDFVSLKDHSRVLGGILERPVRFVDDVAGEKALKAIRELNPGEILVLDNVRFHPDETRKVSAEEHAKSELVRSLAPLCDLFVLDGFSVAHRSHASVVGFARVLPTVAGRVMEAELEALNRITEEIRKPFICILGGSKVEKASEFIEFLLSKGVDLILTGGLAGNLLLHASGVRLGEATLAILERKGLLGFAERMGEVVQQNPDRVMLPVDVAVKGENGERVELEVSQLPSNHPIYDIGSKTISRYVEAVRKAKTVFVSGPLGVYEEENFAKGTFEVFKAIAESNAYSVASGGHTVSALRAFKLASSFNHVSIAGGAFLEYLMGKKLAGVEALKEAARRGL